MPLQRPHSPVQGWDQKARVYLFLSLSPLLWDENFNRYQNQIKATLSAHLLWSNLERTRENSIINGAQRQPLWSQIPALPKRNQTCMHCLIVSESWATYNNEVHFSDVSPINTCGTDSNAGSFWHVCQKHRIELRLSTTFCCILFVLCSATYIRKLIIIATLLFIGRLWFNLNWLCTVVTHLLHRKCLYFCCEVLCLM